jgi:hypothetical protein
VPASHASHVPGPVSFLNVPAGHAEQDADPATFLKVPATQAVHAVPSAPVDPAKQVQFESDVLPVGDCVFAGHATHAPEPP